MSPVPFCSGVAWRQPRYALIFCGVAHAHASWTPSAITAVSSFTASIAGQNGPPGLLAFTEQSVESLLILGFFVPAIPMPLRTFQFATLNGAAGGCIAIAAAIAITTRCFTWHLSDS